MIKVLSEAGNFVKDEVWHALIVMISNASTVSESLVRVAVWCIEEYGEMLVNNVGMLDIEEPMTVSLLLQIFLDLDFFVVGSHLIWLYHML
ncbi:AP-1 complex subunit gamma-1 [Camellia lanceoleosa]|uniref:AP-1 complex subunit gamma-1 n=1 Tax=Camellia lanceoleosa TaxID=1840588 RepID=A0ACC0GE23_9ERIC|nr:AP-1 complex subunit gamma-1 [Camellia lanceoleosa]